MDCVPVRSGVLGDVPIHSSPGLNAIPALSRPDLERPARAPRRTPRAALLTTVVTLAVLATTPFAAIAAGPPEATTAPFGDAEVAVVPYGELIGAAGGGSLNAAVVDVDDGWVAAADDAGHVVAAEIPQPQEGRDFGGTAAGPAPGAGLPSAFELTESLRADGVTILQPTEAASAARSGSLVRYLLIPLGIAIMAMFIVIGFMVIRGRNPNGRGLGGRGGGGGHGKMRKNALVEPPDARFPDVAGCDEAVEELREVVLFLSEPWRFQKVGARMPRGVILHGPPGTGKTLLAKAVAGEAGVPFFAVSGSDFVDTFVGVGASRIRDLFAEARKDKKGAIIFFDEIDAVGRARGGSGGGGGADSEREGTLNQLLVELDGFSDRDRIVVVAATNRLDMLDKALLRPGRFDRRVQVGLPAEKGRMAIMRLHSKRIPLAREEDLTRVASVTAGFAGADLANLLNEAAIMAARDGRELVTAADLDEGMLRALAGPQKQDRRLGSDELEAIAWHEAGHVLAAELCPTHAKTQRVTILSRGDAGGLALYGSTDRALTGQDRLHEQMMVLMAGRAAEQVGLGEISSGAANDLERANELARTAIERLGFSNLVGQIVSSSGPHQMPISGETRTNIDREVARMVAEAYGDAVRLLTDKRPALERIAQALLEHEQLDRDEIVSLMDGVEPHTRPTRRSLPTPDRAPEPQPVAVAAMPAAPAPVPAASPAPAARPEPEGTRARTPDRRPPPDRRRTSRSPLPSLCRARGDGDCAHRRYACRRFDGAHGGPSRAARTRRRRRGRRSDRARTVSSGPSCPGGDGARGRCAPGRCTFASVARTEASRPRLRATREEHTAPARLDRARRRGAAPLSAGRTDDPALVAHRRALEVLRAVVREMGPTPTPAALPGALAGAADAIGAPEAADLARMYLLGARVGADAAGDPTRAARWLEGWSGARGRTPDEARAALAAGIAFGERVLRESGATPPGTSPAD